MKVKRNKHMGKGKTTETVVSTRGVGAERDGWRSRSASSSFLVVSPPESHNRWVSANVQSLKKKKCMAGRKRTRKTDVEVSLVD